MVDHTWNSVNIDLRNSDDEFKHLEKAVANARLADAWALWLQLFEPQKAPQTLYELASNSLDTFKLLDHWQGSQHYELAQLIQRTIQNDNLHTLRTAERRSRQGSADGGLFHHNPLRGAILTDKSRGAGDFFTTPLALLISALQIPQTSNTTSSWLNTICSAAHAHTEANWVSFLTPCSRAPFLSSWHESVRWAKKFVPHHENRPADTKLASALRSLGNHLENADKSFPSNQQPPTVIKRFLGEEGNQDDPGGLPELAGRETEINFSATSVSMREAGEPEITLVVAATPTDQNEPDRHEEAQRTETIRGSFRSAIDNQHLQYHWDSLLPTEVIALIQSLERDLLSPTPDYAIPALACAVALCLGIRPYQFWTLPIGTLGNPGLDPHRGIFTKAIPRPPQSWKPDSVSTIRLQPSTEVIEYPLPGTVSQALKYWLSNCVTQNTVENALGIYAKQLSPWLTDWLTNAREGRYRLTSRRISRVLEIETYALTGRALMAYWIGGSAESTPPSNAYYTSTALNELQKSYHLVIESLWKSAGHNASLPNRLDSSGGFVGSRLVPFNKDVQTIISELGASIPQPDELRGWQAIVDFHNQYTAWVVELLYFATGHRPVEDPFDDHASISNKLNYALIGDKNFGQPDERRLVPLCEMASQQIKCYMDHLRGLFALVPPSFEKLRSEIESQLANRRARVLPVFFFLNRMGNWYSVSPATLMQFLPGTWEYPDNFHRHLLASWLFKQGVDEDTSTQMMGHDDVGTNALSQLSANSPGQLFEPLKGELEEFLTYFGWTARPGLPAPTKNGAPKINASAIQPNSIFGTERRAEERRKQENDDRKEVENCINRQLDFRPKELLNQVDVRMLIHSVKNLSSNQSTRRALLRKAALREQLLAIRNEHKLKIKIPRFRRIVNRTESQFIATSLTDAERGLELRAAFLKHLARLASPLYPTKHPEIRAAYALFALIAFGRVLDAVVHENLLMGKPFHTVADDAERMFIEVQISEHNIRRYPIGSLVASLMAGTSFREESKKKILGEFSRLIATLAGLDRRERGNHLPRLRQIMLNLARLELAGSEVAFLAGESGAVSLPRHDWLRVVTDKAPIPELLPQYSIIQSEDDATEFELPTTSELAGTFNSPSPRLTRQQALAFIDAVDTKKKETWKRRRNSDKTRELNTAPVAALAPKVESLLKEYKARGELPTISQLLGEWLVKLCVDGSSRGRIIASSISTYWSTLKAPLSELAHAYAFNELLSTGLEEVYGQTLEQSAVEFPHRVLHRLMHFHRFVETHYGAPEVDWSEIIPEGFPRHDIAIDAGFVTYSEYQTALQLLATDPDTPELRERTFNCAGLIMFYRFGARAGEIAGLRQVDLQGEIDDFVLRICNDDFRHIKTDAGIRNVPLISQLTAVERTTLQNWRAHIEHCHPTDRLAGLFSDRAKGRLLVDTRRMMSRIGEALVAATGNPDSRPHHCRHTVASQLLYVGGRKFKGPETPNCATPIDQNKIASLLRSHTTGSRRLPWLISSLIGHAHPSTTAHFYGHLNDLQLADRGLTCEPPLEDTSLANALGVDERHLRNARNCINTAPSNRAALIHLASIPQASSLVRQRTAASLPPRSGARKTGMSELETNARVLQAANPGARLECVATRLLLEPSTVFKLLERTRWVCKMTNFVRDPNDPDLLIPDPKALSGDEWRRVFSAASKLDKSFNADPSVLQETGAMWRRGYAVRGNHFLVRDMRDVSSVAKILTALDMTEEQWKIVVDERSLSEDWCDQLIEEIKNLGYRYCTTDKLPLMRGGAQTEKYKRQRVAVRVQESKAGSLRSQKAMQFLYLILASSVGAVEKSTPD